jgi:hypothetical protein
MDNLHSKHSQQVDRDRNSKSQLEQGYEHEEHKNKQTESGDASICLPKFDYFQGSTYVSVEELIGLESFSTWSLELGLFQLLLVSLS